MTAAQRSQMYGSGLTWPHPDKYQNCSNESESNQRSEGTGSSPSDARRLVHVNRSISGKVVTGEGTQHGVTHTLGHPLLHSLYVIVALPLPPERVSFILIVKGEFTRGVSRAETLLGSSVRALGHLQKESLRVQEFPEMRKFPTMKTTRDLMIPVTRAFQRADDPPDQYIPSSKWSRC
ncbi:hypothetical protein J6590_076704 [Homalodisca vitripennis]|nr:hypothetical protein J6590_076704 [Homalodisca vitripennis]